MPYYRGKAPAYPRRRYRRQHSSGVGTLAAIARTAQKAWKIGKAAMSLLNVEHKVFDVSGSAIAVPQAAYASAIHLISQGDTQQTRDGNEVKIESILRRYTLTINASATTTRVRFIFFKDMQFLPGASTPTLSDILENTSDILSPLNISNGNAGNRFVILKDTIHDLNSTMRPQVTVEKFHKISDHLHFVGTSSSDIVSPVYYMFWLSDQATNTPSLSFTVRTRFIDN